MKMSAENPQATFIRRAETINNYDKVFFFTEKLPSEIPDYALNNDKIKIYGKYFDSLPWTVEHAIPNRDFYEPIINEKLANEIITPNVAINFLSSTYYCSRDSNGNRIPLPAGILRRKLFVYDEDLLADPDWANILTEFESKNPSSIQFVNPILCHNLSQFFYLREHYEKVSRANNFILDFFVPYEEYDILFSKYTLKFLCEIGKSSNVKFYVGKNYINDIYNEEFFRLNLYYCATFLFSFLSRKIPMKVEIYNSIYDNPYLSIAQGIVKWAASSNYNISLSKSLRSKEQKKCLEKLIEKQSNFKNFLNITKQELYDLPGGWRI